MTKRWRLSGLLLLTAVVVSWLAGSAGAQTPPGSCAAADAMLNEKTYQEAGDAYAELLAQNKELACAQAGLDFVKVFALADLGLYSEAKTQLAEAVKEHPDTEVPDGLEYLVGGKLGLWRSVKQLTYPLWLPLGELVVFLLILPLVWLALRWRIVPWARGFRRLPPRLDVQAFDDGATGLTLGKGLAAKLEEDIQRFGEQEGVNREPRLLATPIQSPGIPADVQAATPYLKIVSQLIEWALPQKVITLTGFLQKPGGRGAGLSLALAESWTGVMFANQTLWQEEFDPAAPPPGAPAPQAQDPEPYYALTPRAADWVCWNLDDYRRRVGR